MLSAVFIICLVILTKVQDNEAVPSDRLKHEPRHARVDNSKDRSNREQLARIVAFLNNQKREQNDDNRLGDADKESYKLVDVMNLAQKNYNAKTAYDGQKDDDIPPSEVRVHVIKNPEILKEYIKGLRKRNKSTSSGSTEIDSDSLDVDRRLNSHDDIRRNAQFRVDKGKSNEIEDHQINSITSASAEISVEMSKQLQKSLEATPFEVDKSHREKKTSEKKKRNRDNTKKDKSYYARSQHRHKHRANDNPTDPWDMITVTLNRVQENSYENEESDNAASAKKTKKQWGEYNHKGIKDKSNADREQNAWETKSKKGKHKRKEDSWENKDIQWKPSSKASDWYSDKAKEKGVNKNDLDVKRHERPSKKKSYDNEWDVHKDGTKKKEIANEWDVPNDKAKKAEADSWHNVGFEDPLKSTKKSRQRSDKKRSQGSSYDKPSYVPRNDQRASGSGFQGRTPIPFVGRQGIYDDK